MIDDSDSSPFRDLLRPVVLLTGCVVGVALVLAPITLSRIGSAGPVGLVAAAAICLAAGVIAQTLAYLLRNIIQPLGLMLLGMAIRMVPPLAICMILAARGIHGREHLAFIFYLLSFYLVTLALETWLNVRRAGRPTTAHNPTASTACSTASHG